MPEWGNGIVPGSNKWINTGNPPCCCRWMISTELSREGLEFIAEPYMESCQEKAHQQSDINQQRIFKLTAFEITLAIIQEKQIGDWHKASIRIFIHFITRIV